MAETGMSGGEFEHPEDNRQRAREIIDRNMDKFENFVVAIKNGGVRASYSAVSEMHEMRRKKNPEIAKSQDLVDMEKFNDNLQHEMSEARIQSGDVVNYNDICEKVASEEGTSVVTIEDVKFLNRFFIQVETVFHAMLNLPGPSGEPLYSERFLKQ